MAARLRPPGELWTRYHRAHHGRAILRIALLAETETRYGSRTNYAQGRLKSRKGVAPHTDSLRRCIGRHSGLSTFLGFSVLSEEQKQERRILLTPTSIA